MSRRPKILAPARRGASGDGADGAEEKVDGPSRGRLVCVGCEKPCRRFAAGYELARLCGRCSTGYAPDAATAKRIIAAVEGAAR